MKVKIFEISINYRIWCDKEIMKMTRVTWFYKINIRIALLLKLFQLFKSKFVLNRFNESEK